MSDRERIGYVPTSLASSARYKLRDLDSNLMFVVMRLIDEAFAEGHDAGWSAGYEEGRDAVKREAKESDRG